MKIKSLQEERIKQLERIAQLIGSFVAETANERELESLLRENGTLWESREDFEKANYKPDSSREPE